MAGPGIKLAGLSDREGCIDAVLRFVQSIDDADKSMTNSAFTEDCFFDLSAVMAGDAPIGTFTTRKAFVDELMENVGVLDTLHQATNFRVEVGDNDSAKLTCMVLAQHHRAGEGAKPDKIGLIMGNRFNIELKRGDGPPGFWQISKLTIRCAWSQGDMSAFVSAR